MTVSTETISTLLILLAAASFGNIAIGLVMIYLARKRDRVEANADTALQRQSGKQDATNASVPMSEAIRGLQTSAASLAVLAEQLIETQNIDTSDDKPRPRQTTEQHTNAETDTGKKRIRVLVIDDNKDVADSLALLLEAEGHDVQKAYDANDGVTKAAAFLPKLVLLDIGLPGMSGYAVCKMLRSQELTRNAHIVAITAYGQERDKQQAWAAGFNEHMTKRVDPMELSSLLKRVSQATEGRY